VAPVAGLLNTPGIVDGGHTVADLDPIIDLIAELEANLSVPTHIVTGPLGWAELRKLKIGTAFNSTLLGAGTEDAVPLLLGLPVIVTKAITDESGLVVDRRAIAAASSAILVNTSMDRYFEMDQVLLRATWRVGHAVVHPSRIGRFTVGPDGS
jgi:HK97 family phage major capsid protein